MQEIKFPIEGSVEVVGLRSHSAAEETRVELWFDSDLGAGLESPALLLAERVSHLVLST